MSILVRICFCHFTCRVFCVLGCVCVCVFAMFLLTLTIVCTTLLIRLCFAHCRLMGRFSPDFTFGCPFVFWVPFVPHVGHLCVF